MDEKAILEQLEELAQNLEIDVRYESIRKESSFFAGGLCRIKNEYVLIINPKAPVEDQIKVLSEAVRKFDLTQVYLKPGLRDFLDMDAP